MLKSCAAVPEIIEVLINSYSQIPISEKWAEVVPEEVMQVRMVCLGFWPHGTEMGVLGWSPDLGVKL